MVMCLKCTCVFVWRYQFIHMHVYTCPWVVCLKCKRRHNAWCIWYSTSYLMRMWVGVCMCVCACVSKGSRIRIRSNLFHSRLLPFLKPLWVGEVKKENVLVNRLWRELELYERHVARQHRHPLCGGEIRQHTSGKYWHKLYVCIISGQLQNPLLGLYSSAVEATVEVLTRLMRSKERQLVRRQLGKANNTLPYTATPWRTAVWRCCCWPGSKAAAITR